MSFERPGRPGQGWSARARRRPRVFRRVRARPAARPAPVRPRADGIGRGRRRPRPGRAGADARRLGTARVTATSPRATSGGSWSTATSASGGSSVASTSRADVYDRGSRTVDSTTISGMRCGTLPPRQRAVIVLRYYEDLSEADIAQSPRLLGRHGQEPGVQGAGQAARIGRAGGRSGERPRPLRGAAARDAALGRRSRLGRAADRRRGVPLGRPQRSSVASTTPDCRYRRRGGARRRRRRRAP